MNQAPDIQELQQQIMGFSTLIQLQNKSRQAQNTKEFGFLVSNESIRLLPYHQAVFFNGRHLRLETISGVPNPEAHAPYIKWLKKLQRQVLRQTDNIRVFTQEMLPPNLQDGWQEWTAAHGVWCPLMVHGHLLGGIWFTRDAAWQEAELGLLQQLCSSYAYSLHALRSRPKWWNPHLELHGFRFLGKLLLLALPVALLFMPVRLSVLAPAKITAAKPLVVTSPLHGVIKEVHIQPNQPVKKGQLLFSLDDTELRNRHNVACKALEVVREEYKKSRQKSLLQTDKGTDVDLLKAKIDSQLAEVAFAAEELALVQVKAAQDGIALFSKVDDLIGKPVVTGEKIITVADAALKEVEIHVPVENAINLAPGAAVQMFLNVDPSLRLDAVIRQTSFEAEVTEEQILAFIVKAGLRNDPPQLRIGLRGTAKIFGEKAPLYYYLLRRPLAAARRTLGI